MRVQKETWQNPPLALALIGGIVALGFFVWWEKRLSFPLLDLKLFRIPAFTLGNSARGISFIAMSVNNLLMPFFLQLAMGLDPLRAGFLVAPMPFAMALLAPLTGWMSERFLPERLCSAGLAVTSVAFVLLGFLSPGSTSIEVVLWLGLLGVGMGLFQTPNNNLLMSSVPRQRLGIGSSFLSIVRSLGYSAGAGLAATIVSAQLAGITGQISLQNLGNQEIGNSSAEITAFVRGFRIAYLTAAVLCLLGAAVSAVRVSREQK
jgi:MFS family permease